MKENADPPFGSFIMWLVVLSFIGGFIAGGGLATEVSRCNAKDEAVSAGHAEYYLDDEHNRQWRWKDCE